MGNTPALVGPWMGLVVQQARAFWKMAWWALGVVHFYHVPCVYVCFKAFIFVVFVVGRTEVAMQAWACI